jgi:hypothetical protein
LLLILLSRVKLQTAGNVEGLLGAQGEINDMATL